MIALRRVSASTVLLLAGALMAGSAAAQGQPANTPASLQEQRNPLQIVPLSAEELYRGWRASQVLGKPITSNSGNGLGTVRSLILGSDGHIRALVVESGSSTSAGEFVFRIPWDRVEASRLPGRLIADIAGGDDPAYGIFRNDAQRVPTEFAVSEIIGDYARLQAGQGYGYVSDAVFTRGGDLKAVLITREARAGGGTFAFGFPEHPVGRWNAGATYYGLPYATAEHADAAALRVDLTRFANDSGTGG